MSEPEIVIDEGSERESVGIFEEDIEGTYSKLLDLNRNLLEEYLEGNNKKVNSFVDKEISRIERFLGLDWNYIDNIGILSCINNWNTYLEEERKENPILKPGDYALIIQGRIVAKANRDYVLADLLFERWKPFLYLPLESHRILGPFGFHI